MSKSYLIHRSKQEFVNVYIQLLSENRQEAFIRAGVFIGIVRYATFTLCSTKFNACL